MLEFFDKNGGKRWFTDRYDDTEPPDDRKYRVTGKEDKDNPWITFPHAPPHQPHRCIIGRMVSSMSLKTRRFQRWIPHKVDDRPQWKTRERVPTPKLYRHPCRKSGCLNDLKLTLHKIRGVVDISGDFSAHTTRVVYSDASALGKPPHLNSDGFTSPDIGESC